MKVVQINSVCSSGSTGKICEAVSRLLTNNGIENYILCAEGNSKYPLAIRNISRMDQKWQALKSKAIGNYGFQSRRATRQMIGELERISPDIVHLHNLHSHNVHLGLLFGYLKEKNIKVFWTFHDCWAFTGYCMYYDMACCNRWKTECKNCPQRRRYSWFFDWSNQLHKRKKELFLYLNLTIITPSQWMADQVNQSFLRDCKVKVIHNGIDIDLFSPKTSDIRKKYNIAGDKVLLLGVANKWEKRKGLDAFLYLEEILDCNRFQIMLVGTNDEVDKKLPSNIVSIHRTENVHELAEIYAAADYLINPTYEDNFPTVNIEALACGTPVITFDTGGSPEAITNECGICVPKGDFQALVEAINQRSQMCFTRDACVHRASEFDQNEKFREYLELYE